MKNLSKYLKWAGIGFGGLLVILVLALIFLPKLLNLESVKNYLVNVAEKQVNRKITLQKVSFSIFSGIELHNLEMSDDPRFSKGPALKIKKLVLSYDLIPLVFERKVQINQAGMEGVWLLFEQRGPLTNFSSLAVAPAAPAPKKAEKKNPKATSGTPLNFDIKKIYIKDADIKYILFVKGIPTGFDVQDMNFEVNNLNNQLDKNPANLSSSMKLVFAKKVTKLDFNGKLLANNKANLTLNMDNIDGDAMMQALYPPELIKILAATGPKRTLDDMLDQSLAMDFTPLKGFVFNFKGKLGSYLYQKMKVQNIDMDVQFNNLNLNADMKYQLYNGNGTLNFKSLLNRPDAGYTLVAHLQGVESQGYLSDAFGVSNFIRGALNADLVGSGNLAKAYRLNGKVTTVFSDGAISNPEKLLGMSSSSPLGGILSPDVLKALKTGFKTFQINLGLERSIPSLLYIKGIDTQGKGFVEIDFTKNLGQVLQNQAQEAVQKEIDKVKDQAQKDLDEAKKREEERLKKEAEEKLKNLIKF